MKKTVLIQATPHWPTAWGDSIQAWNVGFIVKGMNTVIRDYRQQLGFWTKQNFNIIIDVDKEDANNIVLTHFYSQNVNGMNNRLTKRIDIRQAISYLDADPTVRTCAFGSFFDPEQLGGNQESLIMGSKFFARQTHPVLAKNDQEVDEFLESKFYYLDDPTRVHDATDRLNCICWFFMYKAVDLPIYYIIPNPELMGIATNIDQASNEEIRYMGVDAHFGSVGDLIFRPSFSSNALEIAPTKVVAGDKFHLTPFERGIFRFSYNETVPKVKIKVHTNLDYTQDELTNKIIFEFKPGQETGYVHVKWNHLGIMDLTQSSRSLDLIENRCRFTFDIYRNSKYKYTED